MVAGGGGLLWKPSAGCKTGEVELPDKNSGANLGSEMSINKSNGEAGICGARTHLGEVYAR